MMISDKITISRKEYLDLRLTAAKLQLLEEGGVDNWEWYGDSLHEDNKLTKITETITKEIMS